MKNKLFLRADATAAVGGGHFTRCLALATVAQQKGFIATFISRCETETFQRQATNANIGLLPLKKSHPDPTDLTETLRILGNSIPDSSMRKNNWVLLDGYKFDFEYQKAIRQEGYRTLVVDDYKHLPNYTADIILNQNIYGPELIYECGNDTKQLLGSDFVLLRQEFISRRDVKKSTPDDARKILVTMGASDQGNVSEKILDALYRLDTTELHVKVVLGPANSNSASLNVAAAKLDGKIEIIPQVRSMAEIMSWADIAISAAGSTCWELLFMGVPSLLVVLSEDQLRIANTLAHEGLGINLGWHANLDDMRVAETLEQLMGDKVQRTSMIERGRKRIDGKGAERVVECLLSWSSS